MTGGPVKARGALEVILFEETRFVGSLMFTSPEVTIGSDPGVMVRLEDVDVAPCHAVLRFDGDTCQIEDCGSALGTSVNGVAVATRIIQGMDEISIGCYRLRITVHKADATPTPVSVRVVPKPAKATSPGGLARPSSPPAPALASPWTRPVPSALPVVPIRAIEHTGAIWPPPPQPPSASAKKPATVAAPPVARTISAVPARPVAASAPPARAARPALPSPAPARPATATAVALSPSPRADEDEVAIDDLLVVTDQAPLPLPLALARARLDDDDDDDIAFEPSFSLLDGLAEVGLASASIEHAVEVIRFRHGCVTKLRHLRGGERLRLPGMRRPLGRSLGRGSFAFFRDTLPKSATIREAGQPVDDVVWRRRADKRGRLPLDPGTQVVFPLPSGEGVLVHLVPAATPLPRASLRLRLTKSMAWIGGISLLVHVLVFAIIGLTSLVRREYIVDSKEGRFARIALKEIELEPPAPPPAREKKKAKPEPSEHAPSEALPKVAMAHIPRTRATPVSQPSATAQKLLSALGSMAATPKSSVATAISNIDAVAPVHGGGFKVSGAIGKLPGDSLRLAAAGSGIGRIDTKSANDVGKNLGRVLGRGPTGQVRAQVTAKPNTMKVEGHLDRGEIQRVINSHIHELQGCYERQLIVSPNLSGKVTFEWVIGTSGAVTSVKIKTSTLPSNEATSCMQAAIRRWQFPSPSGGSVTVIYPIALASSGT
jgi:pSer/pThr/pTyr-binding forkhead associated (FHA) protein